MGHDASVASLALEHDTRPFANNLETGTVFSTNGFADAWSRSFADQGRPLAIPVRGSGPPRTMYAIQTPGPWALRSISLSPRGLYASPAWDGQLERSTLEGILRRLMGLRTMHFVWNVRFDHGPLAASLASFGLRFQRTSTHVIELSDDYERVFAAYSRVMRNQVNRTRRSALVVRDTTDPADVHAYFQVYMQYVQQKGNWSFIYPVELILELIKLPVARFLVAEHEGRIIAGGLWLRDGCTVVGIHAASDRKYSKYYPTCAVYDAFIRWGCETGATWFNFGGSGGIASLEQFKSFWGARPALNWMFEWTNPLWTGVSRLKATLRRHLNVSGR